MNILLCMKQVPDTTEIKIDPETNTLIRAGVPSIVNTFDAYALEVAARYSDKRKAFGKKIRSFEAVSFKVADSITQLDAARMLVYGAARSIDAGDDPSRCRRLVSEAKKFATETAWQLVNHAMQILGGIGYTNIYPIERLLRDAAPAKTSQQKLEREFSSREKELQDISAKLKSMGERIDRDAAVLSESDRMRLRREYADLEKDFQRKQREFREDLNQRRNEELAAVLDKANRAIKEIAEREKFDLILQEAVYVSPRLDITDQVVKQLNAGR